MSSSLRAKFWARSVKTSFRGALGGFSAPERRLQESPVRSWSCFRPRWLSANLAAARTPPRPARLGPAVGGRLNFSPAAWTPKVLGPLADLLPPCRRSLAQPCVPGPWFSPEGTHFFFTLPGSRPQPQPELPQPAAPTPWQMRVRTQLLTSMSLPGSHTSHTRGFSFLKFYLNVDY